MDTYVCLLTDHEQRIVRVEAFTCNDEAHARQQSDALKAFHPNAGGYELWHKGRKVASTSISEPA
jgi:hypothetical protein